MKVELPKQLPARLSTLQKACTAAVFDANPAACPAASLIGHAEATTPLVPVSLEGPAYFVSNGNAKFPELIMVLSGYGVTIQIHGETLISKEGITSSTFSQVPDVPYSSSTLTLPEGPYSALASPNGNLCTDKLVMPTTFIAQNGATLQQETQITVTGCKPQLTVVHHPKKHKKGKKGKRAKKASITVNVPAAGSIMATAAGLSAARAHVSKAGEVTLTLALSKAEQRMLAHHPGHQLAAHVKLSFTPSHGRALTGSTLVLVG